jgi:two-component system, OmpR family, KDP operon response regulator KdpE
MKTLLLIDDEPQIRRLLRVVLEASDYKVIESDCGRKGLVDAATRLPDAIILDLSLPDISGLEVLRRLREWSRVPVLILSVQDDGEEKAAALDAGADDYVSKPFHSVELLARLRVLLRRRQDPDEPVFESGLLKIDFATRDVWVDGKRLDLTATEYSLLRVLARHSGKIVTHKFLLSSVWGPKATEQSQYLRVYLSHIRKKLAASGLPADTIRTETGIGYRLTL